MARAICKGQAECLSEEETVEGAWEYRLLTDTLVPLKNPVGETITYQGAQGEVYSDTAINWRAQHVLGGVCYGHTNLMPSFCRAYIAATNREVLVVHAAKGAAAIGEWLPSAEGYAWLVKKSVPLS